MIVASRSPETWSPVTPGATSKTVALGRYLRRLRGRKQYFIGFEDKLVLMPAQNPQPTYQGSWETFFAMTGKYPAAMQIEYHDPEWANRYGQAGTDAAAAKIKAWAAAGAIISIHSHMGNPVTGQLSRNGQVVPSTATATGYWQDRSGSPLAAIKDGGAQEAQFLGFLDRFAVFADTLRDQNDELIPFMWRPFHECTNSNHWWAGTDRQADFVIVWKKMVDYLRGEKGIKNILYTLNYDAAAPDAVSPFSGWWPGSSYVDVVTYDAYDNRSPPSATISIEGDGTPINAYYAARTLAVNNDKPLLIAEFGYQQATLSTSSGALYSTRTGNMIRDIYNANAGLLSWGQSYGPSLNSPANVKQSLIDMVSDGNCITLDKLSGAYI